MSQVIKMTMDLTWINKTLKYLESISFKVFENSGIMLACSILVIPIISLEDSSIMFSVAEPIVSSVAAPIVSSVDEPIVSTIMFSVDEPIVSTWTMCYNQACSLTSATYDYGIKGIAIVSNGIYSVTNGAVIGLGVIGTIVLIENPIEFYKLTKDLISNVFYTLGHHVIGQQDAPINVVLITTTAILGIGIGIGKLLYQRYICTTVKPIEIIPPVQEIEIIVEPDVIVTYIQNLNYLIVLFLIMIILYIVAIEYRLLKLI